ncbi:MAG TPA: SMEK domain-containing protein [Candidatus Hydrogenedentes bacterium]|nr:SMEK domain-containing protein [Candidatus Hydrogenedentota bacterium]HIJ73323.1 SMEK domain-containing protein [Candidatus Hydrogenedentota bacterium]
MSAVFAKENFLKEINNGLAKIEISIRNLGFQGLFDQNVLCEGFFAGLLNTAFGWNLELLPRQQIAVDLIDRCQHLLFQVTASRERRKIQSTIDKFSREFDQPSSYHLRFLIIGQRAKYRKPFKVPSPIRFEEQNDIWDVPRLLERFRRLDTDTLQRIAGYVKREICSSATQDNHVLSERRRIYDAFVALFEELSTAGASADKEAIISQFKSDTAQLPFLGMRGVAELRDKAVSKVRILRRLENRLNNRESQIPNDKFQQWTAEEANLLNWFDEQGKGLVNLFLPYLSI